MSSAACPSWLDAPQSSYMFGWRIESCVCSITARAHHPNVHQLMDIFLAHRLDFILVDVQAPQTTMFSKTRSEMKHKLTVNQSSFSSLDVAARAPIHVSKDCVNASCFIIWACIVSLKEWLMRQDDNIALVLEVYRLAFLSCLI